MSTNDNNKSAQGQNPQAGKGQQQGQQQGQQPNKLGQQGQQGQRPNAGAGTGSTNPNANKGGFSQGSQGSDKGGKR